MIMAARIMVSTRCRRRACGRSEGRRPPPQSAPSPVQPERDEAGADVEGSWEPAAPGVRSSPATSSPRRVRSRRLSVGAPRPCRRRRRAPFVERGARSATNRSLELAVPRLPRPCAADRTIRLAPRPPLLSKAHLYRSTIEIKSTLTSMPAFGSAAASSAAIGSDDPLGHRLAIRSGKRE